MHARLFGTLEYTVQCYQIFFGANLTTIIQFMTFSKKTLATNEAITNITIWALSVEDEN